MCEEEEEEEGGQEVLRFSSTDRTDPDLRSSGLNRTFCAAAAFPAAP